MGFATTISQTRLTIDPRLLDECYKIWKLRDFRGLPPDPHEVYAMSTARYQVFTWAEIRRWVKDEDKRKAAGAT